MPASAIRSKKGRHAGEQLLALGAGPLCQAQQARPAGGSIHAPLLGVVGTNCSTRRAQLRPGATSASSPSAMPARSRTISASAQYADALAVRRQRPRCQHDRLDHAVEVLLEFPGQPGLADAGLPDDGHEPRACARRPVAWKRSFTQAQLVGRGPRTAARARRPGRAAAAARRRATARQSGTGAVLPLSTCSPAGSYAMAASVARSRRLAHQDRAGLRHRLQARLAVLTRSPATMPWPSAPTVDRRLAGQHAGAGAGVGTPRPRRARRPPPTSSRAARTARSASSSWATGAPHTAITASPMNFSTVPP